MTALVSADSAAQKTKQASPAELESLVADLASGELQATRTAILWAREHREEVASALIQALRKLTADAKEGRVQDPAFATLALCILTEFRAAEALPAILELLALPGSLPEDLLEDGITETMPRTLAVLAGDRLELLDELVRDTKVNKFSRWAAVRVRSFLVRDGKLPRDQAIASLQHFLREAIDRSDRALGTALVTELTTLGGREAYQTIVEAISAGIVDETMINLAEVEEELGESNFCQKSLAHLPPTAIEDTIAEIEEWPWTSEGSHGTKLGPWDDEEPMVDSPTLIEMAHFSSRPESLLLGDFVPDATIRHEGHVGRNEPCPCGSGRKFKKCCGKPGE